MGGGIRERTYLVEHQSRQETMGGYEFRADNKGLFVNDKAMQGFRIASGFRKAHRSDRLTDEQENEIAENIYDWWTSGLGYRQWYAQKFLQLKLDFDAPPS